MVFDEGAHGGHRSFVRCIGGFRQPQELLGLTEVALSKEQIQYMREVLGLDSVMVPFVDASAATAPEISFEDTFEPSAVVSEWRSSGDENASKFIILVSSETASFPLDGESGELTRKMIQAMKYVASDVFILEWNHAHTPAPEEIFATLLRQAKPVLIFGSKTARSLIGHFPKIGEWAAWEGIRFVATESPQDLLLHPELKRVAWAHMQAFMKGLSFG